MLNNTPFYEPTITYNNVQKHYAAAWEALPEVYKNDHALTFFVDINGGLFAEHDLHKEEYVWCDSANEWMRSK